MKGDRLYKAALDEASKEDANLEHVYLVLIKAIEKGNSKAIYALGTWYLFGKFVKSDPFKAFELIFQASNYNLPEACFDLAKCYEDGVGVKKSLNKAFESYLKAALLGDKQAIYEVGRCYYYGIGISKNERLADLWLEMAAHYGIEN